jgi:hypothetical protein
MHRLKTPKGAFVLALLGLAIVISRGASESREDLERWWADLKSADGAKGYYAIGQLVISSGQSVPFINEHVHAVLGVPRERLSQLVVDLGSELYAVREKAYRELEKLQDLAEEELRKGAARDPTLEVNRRIDQLLQKLDLLKNPDRLRALRAIEALEGTGTAEAKQVLQRLASGAPEAQLTRQARASLERLMKRQNRDEKAKMP